MLHIGLTTPLIRVSGLQVKFGNLASAFVSSERFSPCLLAHLFCDREMASAIPKCPSLAPALMQLQKKNITLYRLNNIASRACLFNSHK